MECTDDKCKKKYDLACLEINIDAFKAYTQTYKRKWVCPECICSKPKTGNSETPVNIISTPMNNVNTQRGSQAKFSPTLSMDSTLLEELREFRSEMVARMDSQANAISLLINQFSETKTELDVIINKMRVLEDKILAQSIQGGQTGDITGVSHTRDSPPPSTPSTSTFAEVVSHQSTSPSNEPKKGYTYVKTQNVNKSGATKSAVLPDDTKHVTCARLDGDPTSHELEDEESGWSTVRNKKVKRQSKNVSVGTNTDLKAIQATERKKHLHVWRLHPETTLEAITDHVKSVCGSDIFIKVDKIKHKTERDYSSFIIGVPERCYDKLNNSEYWPINAEFDEWIWFRKSTKKTPNE